jgi:hypothetical protein
MNDAEPSAAGDGMDVLDTTSNPRLVNDEHARPPTRNAAPVWVNGFVL